jgi:predicted peptidase
MRMAGVVVAAGLVLALVAACGPAPAPPPPLTEVHLQAGFQVPDALAGAAPSHNTMDYLLWLPAGYGQDPDQSWPLILFLHGAGGGENNSQFVMSYGLPEVLYRGEQPQPFPFIVVSPQAYPGVPWWDEETLLILGALLDEVVRAYRVDPARIYLTGLSMGGYGSWWLATAQPERFAAVVSVSGSGYRTATPPAEGTVCKLGDVPVWAIHGARDMISDPASVKLQVLGLAACGGEVEWTLYPDAGHVETYERAYRDPALYEWLLVHSREQP